MTSVQAVEANVVSIGYDGFTSICQNIRSEPGAFEEPIVLLGGAFQDRNSWGRIATTLAEAGPLSIVELPGWGGADLLPAAYDINFLAEALSATLRAAGHTRVNLMGGSYGGAIAYRLAQAHPEQVARLMLIGTLLELPPDLQAKLRHCIELAFTHTALPFAEFVASILFSTEKSAPILNLERARKRIIYSMSKATERQFEKFRENTLRLLNGSLYVPNHPVAVPTLIATGEFDTFTPPAGCRAVAEMCLNSRFTLFRNADHVIHLEVPQHFADLMLRYFSAESLDDLPYCSPIEQVAGRG